MSVDKKIRVKGSAKQYKLRAGPTGGERLWTRCVRLQLAALRLAKKATPEQAWAARLAEELGAIERPPSLQTL